MSCTRALLSLVCGALLASGAHSQSPLRLNDIQVLGSHNSYKQAMSDENFQALSAARPEIASTLEYWHLPLSQQLDLGIRKLELDVFYDPEGELFPGRAPGSQFPVLHVQNLDDRSSCQSLRECLSELRSWSQQHPQHVPIFISFNAKDSPISVPDALVPLPFDESAWQRMDAELSALLGDRLLTPAQVFASGERSWPQLDTVRGRFVAILDEGGEKRKLYASRWRERMMFANLPAGEPGAAIMVINDPVADFARIREMVLDGYIVRTRADADTREARDNDVTRRDKAFASGAQLISTDYYLPASHFDSPYVVEMDTAVRCNPVLRPDGCSISE
jgi:hypothetical protein